MQKNKVASVTRIVTSDKISQIGTCKSLIYKATLRISVTSFCDPLLEYQHQDTNKLLVHSCPKEFTLIVSHEMYIR